LKGFAIVLVVVGHSIQTLTNDYLENPLFKFHMPLFMYLSGYVCFKPEGEKYINLKKRFKTLIVPFFVWWIISDIYAFLSHKDIISHKHENLFTLYHHFWSIISIPIFSFSYLFGILVLFLTFMESYSFSDMVKVFFI
jgi:acyltransferase 3